MKDIIKNEGINAPLIKLEDVSKIYKIEQNELFALDNVNLTINEGEFVAIIGKSGAGKSTLLNVLGSLDQYDKGKYVFLGEDISKLSDRKISKLRNEKIGFVLQDFALIPEKKVIFNVTLPLYFDKTPSSKIKKIGLEALELMGIKEQAKKKVNQLSGGQKQRVAIARAIIKKPKLILADEPTGALDSKTGKEVLEKLMELNKLGITIIIVTHDIEIANCCKRIITISDGKIISDENLY